jgi:hypothetical protein
VSEDELYLKALGIAMRHYFNLNGEDPEAVHSLLSQAKDGWTVFDVMDTLDAGDCNAKKTSFGRLLCEGALDRLQDLINDIMETFGGET